jgi:CRP/FNR family transcriptional regulator
MTVEAELLQSIPYFSGLSSTEIDSIGQLILEKKAERRDIILYEGEPAEAIYFVVSGVLKLFRTSAEGKEQILSILRPGDSFNEVAVFDGNPNPASVEAMLPVLLYELSKSDFNALLESNPRVSANTIKVLAEKVRNLVALIEDLSFRHVIGRVARILLEYADGEGPGPHLTQQDMAAMAGTAREVVGRSLKALEEGGAIKFNRHRIVIVDRKALREMVESPL